MFDKFLPKQKIFSKKVWLILILVLGISGFSVAQVRTIKGTVTASDSKETLPGATVAIKGTTTGAITDLDGKYSITVNTDKPILVFSYVGYETAEVEVGNQIVLDVQLNLKKTTLDEIVVIGYGSVRKSDLSGSVGSVKSEDITKITALNPVQALQGNVTGVQVTTTSGTPW